MLKRTTAVSSPTFKANAEDMLVRLQAFANGLMDGGFVQQAMWAADFKLDLAKLLRDEEVIS